MEKIQKSSNTAVTIAKVLRTFSIIGLVFSVLGAVCGFAMNGFINQYYQDPSNVAAAQSSLEADMGIFGLIPFTSIKEGGNFGIFFAIQLLCCAVVCVAFIYIFGMLKKTMENVRDTGKAFALSETATYKKTFIITSILILLFVNLVPALIAGILLIGLFNVTVAGQSE